MNNFLIITQVIVSIVLILLILSQNKGTGFGRVWGSSGSSFTRRGLEKIVFRLTFVFAALLIVVSILQLAI